MRRGSGRWDGEGQWLMGQGRAVLTGEGRGNVINGAALDNNN